MNGGRWRAVQISNNEREENLEKNKREEKEEGIVRELIIQKVRKIERRKRTK